MRKPIVTTTRALSADALTPSIHFPRASDLAKRRRVPSSGVTSDFDLVGVKKNTLLVFDDIRLWNMLEIWREIRHPKIDLTSLGHYTGTGLVDWNGDISS